jgi:hypothetical protein
VKQHFSDGHDPIAKMLDQTEKDAVLRTDIYDLHVPAEHWSKGPVSVFAFACSLSLSVLFLFCFFLSGRVVFLGDGEFLLHPFLSYSV